MLMFPDGPQWLAAQRGGRVVSSHPCIIVGSRRHLQRRRSISFTIALKTIILPASIRGKCASSGGPKQRWAPSYPPPDLHLVCCVCKQQRGGGASGGVYDFVGVGDVFANVTGAVLLCYCYTCGGVDY